VGSPNSAARKTRHASHVPARKKAGGVGINPVDGTGGPMLGDPGYVLRFDPKTKLSEINEPPARGYGPHGFDIDRDGIAYVPLSSGHLGAFDRRKCKGPLNGPRRPKASCARRPDADAVPGPAIPQREVYDCPHRNPMESHGTSATRRSAASTAPR
jgi:hypothetical protein